MKNLEIVPVPRDEAGQQKIKKQLSHVRNGLTILFFFSELSYIPSKWQYKYIKEFAFQFWSELKISVPPIPLGDNIGRLAMKNNHCLPFWKTMQDLVTSDFDHVVVFLPEELIEILFNNASDPHYPKEPLVVDHLVFEETGMYRFPFAPLAVYESQKQIATLLVSLPVVEMEKEKEMIGIKKRARIFSKKSA